MKNKKIIVLLLSLIIAFQIYLPTVLATEDSELVEVSILKDYYIANSLDYYEGKFEYYYVSGSKTFNISRYNIDTNRYTVIYNLKEEQPLDNYTNGSIAYFLYRTEDKKAQVIGYDMKNKSEVLDVKLDSYQNTMGCGFVVDKNQNVYLTENKHILVFDKNGNKKQTLINNTGFAVNLNGFDPEEKLLFYKYNYYYTKALVMKDGKFTVSEVPNDLSGFTYGWKFIDNNYAINAYGQIVKWNKENATYSSVLSTGKGGGYGTQNPLFVDGNYIYTSTSYGTIVKFNMTTGIIEQSKSIGEDYIIRDIYNYNDYLYIKYASKSDKYGEHVYITKIKQDSLQDTGNIPFKDVKKADWFYNAVQYVYKNNIIKGYDVTTFAPNDKLTRGQLVTILYRMENSPAVSGTTKFPDVQDSKQYYYKAVKWATDKKIVSGYNTGKFGPNDNITREQLAVILNKYAKYKGKNVSATNNLSEFKDKNKVSSYATSQMKWAVGAGVITGNDDKTLKPQGTATRAEVAAMMEKYCKKVGR